MSETFHERMAYHGYATARRLAIKLPERTGRRLFHLAGRVAFQTAKGPRATVAANMAQVLGRPPDSELVQATVREAFDSYARYWFETFRLQARTEAEVEKRMDFEGADEVYAALEGGKGAIVASPHMGNWDATAMYYALKGVRIVAAAEALKPRRLLDLFVRHRQEFGLKIIPLDKGVDVGRQLAEHLADNWVVGLVADRELSGKGVEVEMFGATRKLPAGPAALSLRTGAPLFLAALYEDDDGWTARFSPLVIELSGDRRNDIAAMTRAMAAEFERYIAASPTDWHMFQPAWP